MLVLLYIGDLVFIKNTFTFREKMSVLIETTLGDIVVDLFVKERPRCSLNFLKLCKTKYFNMNLFHFVQRNFVVQTGDPTG